MFFADAVKSLASGDVSEGELPESGFERAVTAGRVRVGAKIGVISEGDFAEDTAGSKPEDIELVDDRDMIDEGWSSIVLPPRYELAVELKALIKLLFGGSLLISERVIIVVGAFAGWAGDFDVTAGL